MKNLESLKRELVEFTPERFNNVYCNLIDVAQTSDKEYEVLDALSFITDCNLMLTKVNETLENLQDETHCPHCADKDQLVKQKDETIEALKVKIKIWESKIMVRCPECKTPIKLDKVRLPYSR